MPYMAIDKAIMRGEIRMHMINIEKIFICIIFKLLSKKKRIIKYIIRGAYEYFK